MIVKKGGLFVNQCSFKPKVFFKSKPTHRKPYQIVVTLPDFIYKEKKGTEGHPRVLLGQKTDIPIDGKHLTRNRTVQYTSSVNGSREPRLLL